MAYFDIPVRYASTMAETSGARAPTTPAASERKSKDGTGVQSSHHDKPRMKSTQETAQHRDTLARIAKAFKMP